MDKDPGEAVEYYVAARINEALDGSENAPGVLQVKPKKHPRLRAWTGLLALLLGFALVLGSLISALGRGVSSSNREWWKSDWQETKAFQSEVSGYVRDFLILGAGGTLEWYDTAIENGDSWVSGGWWGEPTSDTATTTEDTDAAPDAAYQSDKNVLYVILRHNLSAYTNTDWLLTNPQSLPEGYNFLLIFRDGKAQAWKDGKGIDLYGDGVYTQDRGWYLPGYENFTAGDSVEDVEVRMAVREVPVRYLQGQYDSGYVSRSSPMYGLYEGLRDTRLFYLGAALSLAAGVVLLVIARRLREDRRRAEAAIAARTLYVGTELRFLAVAACLLQLLFGYTDQGVPFWLLFHFLTNIGDLSPATLVGEYLPGSVWMVLENLPLLLLFCLVLWLIHNDHRHNPKEERRSLLRGALRVLRDRTLKLPVQQRLRRWALALPAAMIGVTAASVLLLVIGMQLHWWNLYFAWVLLTVLGFLLVLAVCILSARHQLSLARDMGRLADQAAAIRAGNLDTPLDLPADTDLRQIAEDLNHIQAGLQQALADQTRSERMKVELIANVSHDLKTPLTSILSYAELLRQEPLEGAAADYARIIDQKAQRLKSMVQDVFEVSKAASDQLPVQLERLDLGKLLRQTLADMADPIEKSGLTVRTDLPAEEVPIVADGKRLYRVFQNLIQNALQYSLPGSRIYLKLSAGEGRAEASLHNTSRQELPEGVDFTARFVRGDESRTDGGSGLGLSIARSFTEACGGTLTVETVADLFTVRVAFPLAPPDTHQEAKNAT